MAQPNVLVDVLRGTTAGAHGDLVDTDTAVATNVPMLLALRTQRPAKPSSNQVRVGLAYTARCDPRLDVRIGDRIRTTGQPPCTVIAVTRPPGTAGQADARLELEARQ